VSPVIQHVTGAQQGLKDGGLGGGKWVSWRAVGPAPCWGLAWIGGGDPSGCGSSGAAKGWVSQCGVGPEAGGQHG
jgi:hypothetical protein